MKISLRNSFCLGINNLGYLTKYKMTNPDVFEHLDAFGEENCTKRFTIFLIIFEFVKKAFLKNSSVSAATYVLCIRQLKKYFYPFKAHFESLGKMDTSNMTTYLVAGIDF